MTATVISVVTTTLAIATMSEIRNEVMQWVFLIINVVSLISNLGITLYKQWKKRNEPDDNLINPDQLTKKDDDENGN